MVLEHVVLQVRPGEAERFEATFLDAKAFIAASPGFQTLRLERCVEDPDRYLLLVEWESLEAHTEGFRTSSRYERWKSLLHHFYEPFPTVEHYTSVVSLPVVPVVPVVPAVPVVPVVPAEPKESPGR